ncbi:GSCOCG00004144001-RA-CDS [Cotesia congregata]|uniref:Centriolar and ciliogenesis-associated protein HYLS1 C-terminal domain-containing protein n=1 Tax=Cotesia congregata TaxID=51543 RepID=A0A8J2N0R4_COTCN|nr:GSCOCG00004144001-RA-CDS [Cotesia congregata]CAG5109223.1 Protein of unknown function [Cotesia congregata]
MPHKSDDPRQVLAVLNSLGFVGITADQLKAFMKDLKLLRKIKERERQEHQEELKKKIFCKHQKAVGEFLNDAPNGSNSSDDSVIKIKIKYVSESESEDDENDDKLLQSRRRRESPSPRRRQEKIFNGNQKSYSARCQSYVTKDQTSERAKCSRESEKCKSNPTVDHLLPERAASAPELSGQISRQSRSKSVASDSTRTTGGILRDSSRSLSRTRPKAFIRPWKLQTDPSRLSQKTKSDPVMLYHKYQKEWKQISFLQDNKHANIRWAVREKMLGGDPTPRPILKKTRSSLSVKKSQ